MKYFELSFKYSDKDSGKLIANALLHHAYPKRHQLLFAYDYKWVPKQLFFIRHEINVFLESPT